MMLRDHTTAARLPSLVLLLGVLIMLSILLLTLFTGGVTGQTLSDDYVDNENDNNNNTVVYDVIIIGAGWSGKKRKKKKRTWNIETSLFWMKMF